MHIYTYTHIENVLIYNILIHSLYGLIINGKDDMNLKESKDR